jgi:hypothetical protein
MVGLSAYLSSKKRGVKQIQTHSWFSANARGTGIQTLAIDDRQELRRNLHGYVVEAQEKGVSLEEGPNSLTEKVMANERFNMFSDIDFQQTDVEKVAVDQRLELLRQIPRMYREVVEEMTGVSQRMILPAAVQNASPFSRPSSGSGVRTGDQYGILSTLLLAPPLQQNRGGHLGLQYRSAAALVSQRCHV